jgi:ketosteroid isomerase-like protein
MRHSLVAFLILVSAVVTRAQTGACTESVIKQGHLAMADDAFSYMPPYGKPVIGKPAMQDANKKSFSDRTNITNSWVGEHKIVSSPSGDMAYEYGTVHVGYDDKEGHHEFEAVMLHVYKAKGGVCQMAAMTMQPLEEKGKEQSKR